VEKIPQSIFRIKVRELKRVIRSVENGPVPSKMFLNNKLLARVNSLSYSGYSLSCTYDADISNRITKFIKNIRHCKISYETTVSIETRRNKNL